MIPLTVPEVRRLLLMVAEPPERAPFRLAWSTFRRHHQAVARRCHCARRARRHPQVADRVPAVQVLPCHQFELDDAQWARIAPLLPPQKPRTGRPNHDHRLILAGMLWIVQTGSSWRDLPASFGPWRTIHGRYQRWRAAGLWQRILDSFAEAHAAPVT